jgi:hypothetical protein
MKIIKGFEILFLAAVVLTGCAANPVVHDEYRRPAAREIIVREMAYDEKGMPVPGNALSERPSRPGDHFAVVSLAGDSRPLTSCDIAVVSEKPDFTRPVQAVYEWTGRGFKLGMEATAVLAQGLRGTYSGNEAVVALAFVFTPATAGTVGGFVIGIADGLRQTALEIGKFVLEENDQVLTCTVYDYDFRGRLARMRMLTPDRKQELIVTEFVYEGSSTEPVRTIVKSAEGIERNIR